MTNTNQNQTTLESERNRYIHERLAHHARSDSLDSNASTRKALYHESTERKEVRQQKTSKAKLPPSIKSSNIPRKSDHSKKSSSSKKTYNSLDTHEKQKSFDPSQSTKMLSQPSSDNIDINSGSLLYSSSLNGAKFADFGGSGGLPSPFGGEQNPLTGEKDHLLDDDDSFEFNSKTDLDHNESGAIFDYLYAAYQMWVYDEDSPEFTSQQLTTWAVIIGVFMGIATAKWSALVEFAVEFVWKEIPETLLEWNVFTDSDGPRPLAHYMWICPAIFGGLLSYITHIVRKPIPGQNEWIDSLHRRGLMEYDTGLNIFFISTAGMASGLSLGPELPLVLTAGMVGSYLAKITRQSLLSARVLNLTAASAAIGGFFGFPMAGALFVLELPHQMGLQYFEALYPSIFASIVSVLTNRMVLQNDVTGYFDYPPLRDSLPSHIVYAAVLYGALGSIFGILYVKGCLKLKTLTHDLFHAHDHHDDHHHHNGVPSSNGKLTLPLAGSVEYMQTKSKNLFEKITSYSIKNESVRVSVVGVIAGALVGVICMFFPHLLFWGEAQLQTLIDNGRTPLPIFGREDEPTAALTAYGYCLTNEEDDFTYSIGCSAVFVFGKIIVIGLSLGTGIIGGHFWGPLYVGAAASNLFTGLMRKYFGIGVFTQYPCLVLVCFMGSTHVVTFKANMAIILILTMTISSFHPDSATPMSNGGDYSAILPLLVVACFAAWVFTRKILFYKKQANRGDLNVIAQTLCEPGKFGESVVRQHHSDSFSEDSVDYEYNEYDSRTKNKIQTSITQDEIERNFNRVNAKNEADSNQNQVSTNTDTSMKIRTNSVGSTGSARHKRVSSFGEIYEHEMLPTLLDQAREGAASKQSATGTRPKFPKRGHRRTSSDGRQF